MRSAARASASSGVKRNLTGSDGAAPVLLGPFVAGAAAGGSFFGAAALVAAAGGFLVYNEHRSAGARARLQEVLTKTRAGGFAADLGGSSANASSSVLARAGDFFT